MPNILILNGSPRLGGNTYSMIESFKSGAEKNNKIVQYNLAFMNIHDSVGYHDELIEDDMKQILSSLDESDYVVFATPLYFFSYSGYLKNVIDRLSSYKGKKKLLLFVSMASCDSKSLDVILEETKRICTYLEWDFEGFAYLPSCKELNDYKNHSSELEKPYQLGLSIK